MRQLILLALVVLVVGIGFTIFAQGDEEAVPILQISVAGETCDLALEDAEVDAEATPELEAIEEVEATEEPEVEVTEEAEIEATEEADSASELEFPIITLAAEGCEDVVSQLRVARNGTLWVALSVPEEEDWQLFTAVEDDDFPPQFDRRGRFVGCSIPQEGEQVCRMLWELEGETYQIEIPIIVGTSFTASSGNTNTTTSTQAPSTSTGTGQWGACGSCSTCGANANVCVTSPEGACVADPANCSGPPEPMRTEEP